MRFDVFVELLAGCPRQGPGSEASTERIESRCASLLDPGSGDLAADDRDVLAALGDHRTEQEMLRRFADVYDCVFYVARRTDA